MVKTFEKQIDSIFYKSKTSWVMPTPFVFNKQFYSVDSGATYKKVGFFGQNVKRRMAKAPGIRTNINLYTTVRILGLSQMAILAPYFVVRDVNWLIENDFKKKPATPHTAFKRPPNLWIALGVYITGSITFYLLSKPFLRKALAKHHRSKRIIG